MNEPPKKIRRKSFFDIGDRMRKERTNELLASIATFREEDCPELSMNQILGYMLYRTNIKSNREIAAVGQNLFISDDIENLNHFEVDEAVAFMHSLTLSKQQMRDVRSWMSSKGIYFPTTNELLDKRANLRHVVQSVLDGKGVCVDYVALAEMTVKSILRVCKSQGIHDQKHVNYKMYFKDGADGAGQQVVWRSKSMKNSKQNMFQYGLTALRLTRINNDTSETMIWENSVPNYARSLRPVYLIRDSETDEDLLKLVIPFTDKARDTLNDEGMRFNFEGNDIVVSVSIIDSMKDLKFKKMIIGLGGADCILCYNKRGEWTDKDQITKGFPIQRNSKDTFELYQELTSGESLELERKSGDFDTRKGLTKKPLTTSSQMSITVTHSYINGTWFLKLLYR